MSVSVVWVLGRACIEFTGVVAVRGTFGTKSQVGTSTVLVSGEEGEIRVRAASPGKKG